MATIHCKAQSIRSADYPAPAARPSYSLLECEKFQKVLKHSMSGRRLSVQQYLLQIVEQNVR